MQSHDGDERRRGERVAINAEFRQLGAERVTFVSDLSAHGVFVHTSNRLPIGTHIELRFTAVVEDPLSIQALGKVVRYQDLPSGMGVEFGPLSPEMVDRIESVLSEQKRLAEHLRVAQADVPTYDIAARPLDDDELELLVSGGHLRPDPAMSHDRLQLSASDLDIVSDDALSSAGPEGASESVHDDRGGIARLETSAPSEVAPPSVEPDDRRLASNTTGEELPLRSDNAVDEPLEGAVGEPLERAENEPAERAGNEPAERAGRENTGESVGEHDGAAGAVGEERGPSNPDEPQPER